MALWKVTGKRAQPVQETSFHSEDINEEAIEAWIAASPEILGEKLLIFGRQVPVEGLGDRIDLLALDPNGAVVVVEVKRADIKAPVDMQALRYASYVSRWDVAALEGIAQGFFDPDNYINLLTRFEAFADSAEGDEESSLNSSQRIIIVGQRIRDRLGSVALWLRAQGIDIKLIEVRPFRNGNELFLDPRVVIPPPTAEEWEAVGSRVGETKRPWLAEGPDWHRKRAGDENFERAQSLVNLLEEAELADEVSYDQKHYIALRRGDRTWIFLRPRPNAVVLDIRCSPGDYEVSQLAKRLGLAIFEKDDDLKAKLALPSSVGEFRRGGRYGIRLRLKPDYQLDSSRLLDFLREASTKWA